MNSSPEPTIDADRVTGFVVGMAVGDALGLPREGLTARRASRLFGSPPLEHRFVFGRGMVSDDTEHMRMTAAAFLAESQDSRRFARRLAWKLRWWMLGMPAGVGLATARSIIRLWLGWRPDQSGVHSAGNGPAMRAGILGLCLHRDHDPLHEFVKASTRLTHADPRAETGALLIALAAREAVRTRDGRVDVSRLLQLYREQSLDSEWKKLVEHLELSLAANETASQFAERLGIQRGVTGYIVPTVGVVLFCWLRWPGEFRRPVEEVILLGGDTDTTAAILGGLAGATCGVNAIPAAWLDRMIEWPCSVTWMRHCLVPRLRPGSGASTRIESPIWRPLIPVAQLGRNLVFLLIVLWHGFRRLLPPF